ncbi:uncharacterized protein G2W53_018630 [Senna tora]|uniref:Reverse transcriptase domain-containing protein n=1 Tax=Senna tora TaxID=362788 RepID=A0A834WQ10_9FABA|nr:uncharacterized protein G2W53_018630 [Senna tora]
MPCMSTVSYKLTLNGGITKEFRPSCGIRQGDPISPYLFILCASVLSCMIAREEANGLWKGIKIVRGVSTITHLMYADDTVLFFQLSPYNIAAVQSVLSRYSELSGQHINFSKSFLIFSPNTPYRLKKEVSENMRFRFGSKLGKYLGTWVDNHMSKKDAFDDVLNKIHSHEGFTVVSDLIKHDSRSWNQDLLFSLYDANVARNILTIPLSITIVQDRILWKLSKDDLIPNGDVIGWITRELVDLDSKKRDSKVVSFLCITLHSVWYFRNKRVMEGKNFVPSDCLDKVYRVWKRLEECKLLTTGQVSGGLSQFHVNRQELLPQGVSFRSLPGFWDWMVICHSKSVKVFAQAAPLFKFWVMVVWHQQLVVCFDTQVRDRDKHFQSCLLVLRKGIQVVDQDGSQPKFCHLFVPNVCLKNLTLGDYRKSHNCQVLGQDISNIISSFQRFKVSVGFLFLWDFDFHRRLLRPMTYGLDSRF